MVGKLTEPAGGETAPPRDEALAILDDTAKAVRVMKASWLRVALNLKVIRRHDLWRLAKPRCENYEDYVLGVLKLNRYVAGRMLRAVDYTETRRPDIIQRFHDHGDEADVPSFEVVDQLRRASTAFGERDDELRDIESRVFDEGMGRVHLRRAIDERLGRPPDDPETPPAPPEDEAPATVAAVLEELKAVEKKLLKLKVSREARQLMFQLIETLNKEK